MRHPVGLIKAKWKVGTGLTSSAHSRRTSRNGGLARLFHGVSRSSGKKEPTAQDGGLSAPSRTLADPPSSPQHDPPGLLAHAPLLTPVTWNVTADSVANALPSLVPSGRTLCPPGDIWKGLGTVLILGTARGCAWEPGMLLSIIQPKHQRSCALLRGGLASGMFL